MNLSEPSPLVPEGDGRRGPEGAGRTSALLLTAAGQGFGAGSRVYVSVQSQCSGERWQAGRMGIGIPGPPSTCWFPSGWSGRDDSMVLQVSQGRAAVERPVERKGV